MTRYQLEHGAALRVAATLLLSRWTLSDRIAADYVVRGAVLFDLAAAGHLDRDGCTTTLTGGATGSAPFDSFLEGLSQNGDVDPWTAVHSLRAVGLESVLDHAVAAAPHPFAVSRSPRTRRARVRAGMRHLHDHPPVSPADPRSTVMRSAVDILSTAARMQDHALRPTRPQLHQLGDLAWTVELTLTCLRELSSFRLHRDRANSGEDDRC